MTATTTAPPAALPSSGDGARGAWRAVLALARFEARRLLLHPLVLLGLATYLGFMVWFVMDPGDYPALQNVDRDTQIGMELLGLVVLIAANLTVLRPRMHGTDAHFDVLVLRPWHRTVACLLALLPLTMVCVLIVTAQLGYAAARPGAVGHASVAELATGPTAVLLLGSVGVLLGRIVTSLVVAPLTSIALVSQFFMYVPSGTPRLAWLTPVVYQDAPEALPSQLLGRPAAWHVLYLLALTALVGAGAAWLSRGGRVTAVKVTAAGALAVTLATAFLQLRPASPELEAARRVATNRPSGRQDCRVHDATTYCAFPEFVSWTDEWDSVVQGVRALVPEAVARRPLYVRQRTYALGGGDWQDGVVPQAPTASWARDDRAAGTPDSVTAGTAWGGGVHELELAASVAYKLVTGRAARASGSVMCSGRGVLAAWLATQATERTEDGFADLRSGQGGGAWIDMPASHLMITGSITLRSHEYAVLQALLELPSADVGERVKASWKELVSPSTSTAEAAKLLGVTAPPVTDSDREYACE